MEAAQSTFISSTFWTERIGPAAALKTLDVMGRERSWEQITATGKNIADRWLGLAKQHNLDIGITGLPALIGFGFQSSAALEYKTFITQEMLKKGYLAGTSVYVCIEHTPEILDHYFETLEPIFEKIGQCEISGGNATELLDGPVCHSGFKRLN